MQDLRCCPRGVLSLYLSLNFGICWFDVWFYVVYVFNLLNLLECDRKLWNVFVLCCGLIFVLICVLMVKRNLVFNFVIRFRVVRCMVLWPIRLLRSRICVQLHQWWIFLFILVTYLLVAQAILEIRREEGRIFFPPEMCLIDGPLSCDFVCSICCYVDSWFVWLQTWIFFAHYWILIIWSWTITARGV